MLNRIGISNLSLRLEKYKTSLTIIFAALLFLILFFLIYIYYLKPNLTPSFVENKEYVPKDSVKKAGDLYFFYASWCPYSKKALKNITQYRENNPTFEKVTINYIFLQDENDDTNIVEFEKKYNKKIDGYPTIYFIYNNQVIEFDAIVNDENLNTFFNSVI